MALDQSQEHSIQYLKEDSGANGLYGQKEDKDINELPKPEVFGVIDEFEIACFSASTTKENLEHPESSTVEQNKFLNQVQSSPHWTLAMSWIQLLLIA